MLLIALSCAFLLLMQPAQAQTAASTAASISISTKANSSPMLYPAIQQYLQSVSSEFDQISAERKEVLAEMAAFVRAKNQQGEAAELTFICTHNSRRSHMAQLWAAAAVDFYGKQPGIRSYSGGTEVTAFNPRAVKAMREAGFDISAEGSTNPTYTVKWTENQIGSACFSKHYAHPSNPQSSFGAVMRLVRLCSAPKTDFRSPTATPRKPTIRRKKPRAIPSVAGRLRGSCCIWQVCCETARLRLPLSQRSGTGERSLQKSRIKSTSPP
jgi:arsenate reductase